MWECPDIARRTLYEDWQARRDRLAALPSLARDNHAVELQVLDFLLRRYRDSPEVARPARFPLSQAVYVNHRAIVVLRHLGGGSIPTITTAREAETRVRSMVARMSGGDTRVGVPGPRPPAGFAPGPAEEDRRAESLRMGLCDRNPQVRIEVASRLGLVGDLDDIGLLADLLALPPSQDEHPGERGVLARAMQQLAGMIAAQVLPCWKCIRCGAESPASADQCEACAARVEDQVLDWLGGP